MRKLICDESKSTKNEITAGILKVQESVDALSQSVNERINIIEEGQHKLGKKVVTLEGNIKANTEKIKALEEHPPGDESILDEVEDRLARRNNVLLFNLPEPIQSDLEARSEADASLITKICNTLGIDSSSSSLTSQYRVELHTKEEDQPTSPRSGPERRSDDIRSYSTSTPAAQRVPGRSISVESRTEKPIYD
ncbi:Protein of unknown function [Cotesia congregata]|uniref:Uncharacterized protein n=1 Tax=Cotesia congregata TaxID=51543 RepID=A0A8J2HLT8_COTCN|nr:Protein of unknown function [Cotesia congregata]